MAGAGSRQQRAISVSLALLLLLLASAVEGHAPSPPPPPLLEGSSWCDAAAGPLQWSEPLHVASQVVLGKHDVYSCAVLTPPPAAAHSSSSSSADSSSINRVALEMGAAPAGTQLRQALLLDCDAQMWQLAGIQGSEERCIASTSVLAAACNQWLVTIPAAGQIRSQSCAPPSTAFATPGSLKGRVLVLQAHWRLPDALVDAAVTLPSLQLQLGSQAAPSAAPDAAAGSSAAGTPPLLGTFVGSGIYPPSRLSGALQAFQLPAPADGSATATASLACSKRCTYVPLGKLSPRPVTVVGYSFSTFDRATNVSFEIQRGKWGRSDGQVLVAAAPGQGVVQLQQPFKLHAGDTVRWRCSYDMSTVQPGSALSGGFSSSPGAQQEQCTVRLHYWPRVEAMRGCSAALDTDKLLGENMCSSEAQDLLHILSKEELQFPMRRMYQEHSFPAADWMGGWKATHIILQMAAVWACLWGFQTLLSTCKALGPIHTRFISLAAGQQRNVSLYLTHLLLDTLALAYVFQPMIELWLGLTETVAEVQAGMWGFTYLVACYTLELTWRRSIDTMLAIHHVGTITIILLYAGELTSSTYRVANNIIVLAAFALLEQPTYVALLLKRMMPSHSVHVVRAARVGYISWFILKGASVLLAASMFVEDWHIMPTWVRVNFLLTWVVAALVQGWSGFIQRGIYRHIKRSHKRSKWEHHQDRLKRHAALALHAQACPGSSDDETDGSTPPSRGTTTSQDGLAAPLLSRRGRIAVAASEDVHGSPFELIAANMPDCCGDSTGLTSSDRTSSCTSQASGHSSDANEQSDALARWEPVGFSEDSVPASIALRQGHLSTSSSLVALQQSGTCVPLLPSHGSLPVSLEGLRTRAGPRGTPKSEC